LLIENPKLRQKMGEDARWQVAYGKTLHTKEKQEAKAGFR
jgi:hypothetical protein